MPCSSEESIQPNLKGEDKSNMAELMIECTKEQNYCTLHFFLARVCENYWRLRKMYVVQ
jgi:hypothetical protein